MVIATAVTLVVTALWCVAGHLVATHTVRARALGASERMALAGALGLVILTGATGLALLPRPAVVAVAALLAAAVPWWLYRHYRRVLSDAQVEPVAPAGMGAAAGRWPAIALLSLIAVAAFFRFVNLDYSELQGDEARAALMAHQLGRSRSFEVLLLHKKGPLEVLLPAAAIGRGDLGEATARLPFAIAGFLGVLAAFALGRRMWGARAGWIAALLLAVDGYLIAFSRIVQYQSVVFLFSVLAVWCAWRFYRRVDVEGPWLALAGLFLGLGTWAHYEMVFAAPPVAWLVAARAHEERWSARQAARRLAPALGVMLGVSALFYIPFIRHPQFAETWSYIAERRVGGGLPYNMLGDYFQRASFYNASYSVMLMGAAITTVVAARLRAAWGRAGAALAAAWLAAFALVILRPGWFEIGPADADPRRSLAVVVFLPVLAALALAPASRLDAGWRAVILWFAGPFFAAAFFVQKPHTHFYTMIPAWALMVGWGVDRGVAALAGRFGPRPAHAAGAVLGTALFAVFAVHQYAVFIRHTPEYKRVYPEARLPGYWVPFGDEPPRGGYFGFPYRAGWNTVRPLVESGLVSGAYDSNEERLITGWYTAGAPRCFGGDEPAVLPRHYVIAWRPQDAEEIPLGMIERDYPLDVVVQRGGMDKLKIYTRDEVAGDPWRVEDGRDVYPEDIPDFGLPGVAVVVPPPGRSIPVAQALELPLPEIRRGARLGGAVDLVGVDFPLASEAYGALAWTPSAGPPVPVDGAPAGSLGITLVWRSAAPLDRDLSVFIHVVDADGRTIAQSDGAPGCGLSPTSTWSPGDLVFDPHAVDLPGGLSAGVYTVRAGLYDPADGTRLTVLEAGAESDAVPLWSFELGEP